MFHRMFRIFLRASINSSLKRMRTGEEKKKQRAHTFLLLSSTNPMKWNTSLGKCKVILIFGFELIKASCVSFILFKRFPSCIACNMPIAHERTHKCTHLFHCGPRDGNDDCTYSTMRRFSDIYIYIFFWFVLLCGYFLISWTVKQQK